MTFKTDSRGIAIALLSTATWATAGIFIRWLPGWSPFAILSGRFFVATLALLPVVLSPNIRPEFFRTLRSPTIWGLSLPMISGFLLGTAAFQMAQVGEVTLMLSTPPIFVVVYKLLAKIRVYKSEGIGTLLAIAGIGLILQPQLQVSSSGYGAGISWEVLTGYLFALSAAALLAAYTLWFGAIARQGKPIGSINVVFITCLLGCILSSICTILFSNSDGLTGLNQQAMLVVLGLGILPTAMSTLCYTIAAQRLPAILAAAILLTEPMFAVLFASILLKESPSFWFGLGSCFVLSGLLSIANGTEAKL
ncbi:MAG: DMT family transporter [Phormidesmis sp.]